jgi:periplasmic divalent cation tolerance protein
LPDDPISFSTGGMTDKRIALTTTATRDEAQKIALGLVEQRLAACVNVVGPIDSTYSWRGQVERSSEFLLIIKTTADAVPRLEAAIKKAHSYETPEFVVLPIERGSAEYLQWLAEAVG